MHDLRGLRLGSIKPERAYYNHTFKIDPSRRPMPLAVFTTLAPFFEQGYSLGHTIRYGSSAKALIIRVSGFPYIYIEADKSSTVTSTPNLKCLWSSDFLPAVRTALSKLRRAEILCKTASIDGLRALLAEALNSCRLAWGLHFALDFTVTDTLRGGKSTDEVTFDSRYVLSREFLTSAFADILPGEEYVSANYGVNDLISWPSKLAPKRTRGLRTSASRSHTYYRDHRLAQFISDAHTIIWDNRFAVLTTKLIDATGVRLVELGLIQQTEDIWRIDLREFVEGVLHVQPEEEESRHVVNAVFIDYAGMLSLDVPPLLSQHKWLGLAASPGRATGPVQIARCPSEGLSAPPGSILVVPNSQIGWALSFNRIAGFIAEVGGITSHAANLARATGIPAIVGFADATSILRNGEIIMIDGDTGTTRTI